MIRKISKLIHVSNLQDGESATVRLWNGDVKPLSGITVKRTGNSLKGKLPEFWLKDVFFIEESSSGICWLDSMKKMFMVERQ